MVNNKKVTTRSPTPTPTRPSSSSSSLSTPTRSPSNVRGRKPTPAKPKVTEDNNDKINIPSKNSKKMALLSSSDEEEEDEDEDEEDEEDEDEGGNGTSEKKGFTDQNAAWLKPASKKTALPMAESDEEEGTDDDDEDEDEDEDDDGGVEAGLLPFKKLEKRAEKEARKKQQIEVEAQEDFQLSRNIKPDSKYDLGRDSGEEDEDEDEEDDEEDEKGEDGEDSRQDALEDIHQRIQETVGIFANFKERRPEGKSRADLMERLRLDVKRYFGYSDFLLELYFNLFSPAEALSHIESNETSRPLTIRTNTLKSTRRDLAQTLMNKGVNLDPIKWSKVGLVIYESQVPIGATPEYLAGHYMVQSAASFLPVMALDPQPNEKILDMCAAPGGKTTHIAALMKNTGSLHANDIHKGRLPSLVANLHRMGVQNCTVSNLDGRKIPSLPTKYNRVMLDAPCMGLGVVHKDPSVKSSKTEDDMRICTETQRHLILAAIDAIDVSSPEPILVYSTCSISVEENEEIIAHALKHRWVKVVEAGLEFGSPGISSFRGKKFHASIEKSRRYYPHSNNIDGFFVCKLRKIQDGKRTNTNTQKAEEQQEEDIEALSEERGSLLLKSVYKQNQAKAASTTTPNKKRKHPNKTSNRAGSAKRLKSS